MNMDRHAYLIMAHTEFVLLKKLIILLDDPRNDIFVHVDKKAKDFQIDQFRDLVSHSNLHFIPRHHVTWGGYSVTNTELVLLKEALGGGYAYYHLLSGVDLPIKNQDEIHAFFENHPGMEFLYYDDKILARESFYDRVKYFHFFQEIIGRSGRRNPLFHINKIQLAIQKHLGVNRIKNTRSNIKKGTTWFSITRDLARFVVSQEHEIRQHYKYTCFADETYLHTLVWNSDFRSKIYNSSLRYTDWERGQPYTFHLEDYETLVNSNALWARKFSQKVDPEIIDRIFKALVKQ
jgi:Core-2/I-Branching enzyme